MSRFSLVLLVLYVFALGQTKTNLTVKNLVNCNSDEDCSAGQLCVDTTCKDPCFGACGANTNCHLVNVTPRCSCLPGFVGHPFTGCEAGTGTSCNSNSDCPLDKVCSYYQCKDPCPEECGEKSDCKVINHYPVCACSQGYAWNSERGCQPQSLNSPSKYRNGTKIYKLSDLLHNILSKKKFYASTYKATWMEAVSDCALRGMDFATISSQQDQNDVEVAIKSIRTEDSFFVSGMRLGENSEYMWAPTGKPFSYTYWGTGEPAGNENHCVYIPQSGDSPYQWESTTCSSKAHFLCEYYVI